MNIPPLPPLKALELRQSRYFSILARKLHFGRAADAAYVSQPALSQQIAKLEELVGVPLFVRDRRGVTLTPAGEASGKVHEAACWDHARRYVYDVHARTPTDATRQDSN